MKAEAWLKLDDVEVANALRTLSYLRRGLAGATLAAAVALADPLRADEGTGYSDIYSDIYGGDSFLTENLASWCGLIDSGPYARPNYDPAPWYDPRRPESADFLGLWPDHVEILSSAQRNVTVRVGGGGNLGPVAVGPRVVQVTGTMFSASRAGMAYGQAWLRRCLLGADTCEGSTLSVLPSCPPDGEDPSYVREVAAAGLITAPTFSAINDVASCLMQNVAFQLAGADGYLRAPKRTILARTTLSGTTPLSAVLVPTYLVSDAALIATIEAGSDTLDGLVISAGSDAFTVVDLPVGQVVTVDASLEEAWVRDSYGATVGGGLEVLDADGLFPWISTPDDTPVLVLVDASAASYAPNARVTLEAVDREL